MNVNKRQDWEWPENGHDQQGIAKIVASISSPYEQEIPPFCYPGTTLPKGVLGRAKSLLAKQINAIGSHTHIEIDDNGNLKFQDGEGGFEVVQRMEAEAIWMLASVIGGTPATTEGYFCGGGTEANIEGLWIGRQYLRQCPDPNNRGIVALATPLQHFSISQALEMLDFGEPQWLHCVHCSKDHLFTPDHRGCGLNLVGMNERGEMDIGSLQEIVNQKIHEGFRRFLIIATAGTTVLGSIDPIEAISNFIDRNTTQDVRFYLHVDASFGGFTIPFCNINAPKIGFNVPNVMSVTIDGDKMGRLPYPAGVFLCRKDLMRLVARRVQYVRGHDHDTVSGSRSCLSPVLARYLFQAEGQNGQRKYVQQCLETRNELVRLIKENANLNWIKIMPYSPHVNFAPMVIDIEGGEIPKQILEHGILQPYHLRSDYFPKNTLDPLSCPLIVYKICIMPHTIPFIKRFVSDLDLADQEWKKAHQ
ncbi:MAG: pyridoxal-dependent decarboxylase [Patescibacteria group bacterium]|jgi:tyrosine decarboxylase/aspartate 1-decarboxylase